MQTTTIERVEGKLTVDAGIAVKTLNLCEHNLYCLLVAAEKNAIDDCGELASITRKHIEDAAQFLGIRMSVVIFKNRTYTACEMRDGSLVVTKNKTQEGRRLIGENAPYWIDSIKTAIDADEAAFLCRAMFS